MIVHCETCGTDFRLEDSMVKPEGSWVRCSKCKEVFQVFGQDQATEASAPPPAQAQPGGVYDDDDALVGLLGDDDDFDGGGLIDLDGGERPLEDSLSEFSFDEEEESKESGKGPGLFFKLIFWLVGLVLVAGVGLVGGGLVLKNLGLQSDLMAKISGIPGISQIMSLVGAKSPAKPGPDGVAKPAARPEANVPYTLLALRGVKSYFRFNDQAGRIFVIEGLVDNKGDRNRASVMVVGRLHSAKGNVEMKQNVYAGPILSQDQLKSMSMMEIQAKLSSPLDPAGNKPFVLLGGQAMPFMIVFAKLPENLAEYTAEVVGSKPAAASGPSGK